MWRLNSCPAYSIVRLIVGAVVVVTAMALGTDSHRQAIFPGETLGWFGAMIARSVYPPPTARQSRPR